MNNTFAVIISIIVMKHLRQLHHLLLINLAIFDLVTMSMGGFALLGVFYGDTLLPQNRLLCEISGVICMPSCFGGGWTMMLIAINRYNKTSCHL